MQVAVNASGEAPQAHPIDRNHPAKEPATLWNQVPEKDSDDSTN